MSWFKPLRPQVFVAIVGLIGAGVYALYLGEADVGAGALGLAGGLTTKLIDTD